MTKKTKRKAYFLSANPSKKRKSDLSPGLQGFICTCNGKMNQCIKEAFNILDDYSTKLNPNCPIEGEDDDDDIEVALKKELAAQQTVRPEEKDFRAIDTGVNNCIFISTTLKNPTEIVEGIMKDMKETKQAKSRCLIRMLPVDITCKAFNDDIKKAADSIFDRYFKGDPTTYCININKRSNSNLLRDEITDDLARLVRDRNRDHKVDLKKPIKSIIVEIIRNICCLSVVTNFYEYKKYNLIALAMAEDVGEHALPAEVETNPVLEDVKGNKELGDPSDDARLNEIALLEKKAGDDGLTANHIPQKTLGPDKDSKD